MAKRIGELLVEGGVLSQSQLEQALFAQRKDGRKLGLLLVELGFVTEVQVTQVLSRQLSVPWVSLYHVDFSRSLLNLVPREIAEKYCLVPIFVRRVRKQGETLYVAMDDPTSESVLHEVADAAAMPVKPMIACPSDIRAAIRVYYLGEEPPPPPAPVPLPPPSSAVPKVVPTPPASGASVVPPLPERAKSKPDIKVADSQPPPSKVAPSQPQPPAGPAEDSPESAPEIHAEEREAVIPKRKNRPRMVSLTLLDGTTISIPAPPKQQGSVPDIERPAAAPSGPQAQEYSDQLTARDLVSALRAVAHGADASEILGVEPRWESIFSALLSLLLRKGLIADWEFVEEFRKI